MGSLLPFVVLSLVCACLVALGVRVFRRARAVDGFPERCIGVFFVAIGLEVMAYTVAMEEAGLVIAILVTVSSCALIGFVRAVFRPNEAWARVLGWALAIAITLVFVTPHLLGGPTPEIRILWSTFRGAALVWALLECAAYHRRMRRQLSIGLADPVVANRFLLWSLWIGGTAVLPLSGLGLRILAAMGWVADYTVTREPSFGTYVFAALIATGLVTAAVALWLSFSPPGAYKRWIQRRGEALAAG